MAGSVVGIDLGTTNTVVAVVKGGKAHVLADEDGARLLPSVVSFHPNGETLVGAKARERRLVDARNTISSIKRLIGRSWQSDEVARARQRFPFELREGPTHGPLVVARNETYTLPEISAFVLRRAKEIAERSMGEAVERAVVTVPASFNDLQRASTKVAAREAGLEVMRILNEPTAAALAYGFGKQGNERIAVYDFGGGTFDLTLLDLSGNVFEVIATAGDSFLGGDDLDYAIADRIANTVLQQTRFDPRGDVQIMERLRAAAEQVKVTLSSQQDVTVDLKEVGYAPGGKAIDLKFQLGRTELEQLAMPFVERTFNVCQEALGLARLKHDAFDNIILVGGSTRVPLVRRRVEQFFGKKPLDRVNPEEVVAIGAAIQAAALTGAERRRQSTPAPVMNTDAVKQTRIQTLGGTGKTGARAPIAPPPQRTTGRIVGPSLSSDIPPPPVAPQIGGHTAKEPSGLRAFQEALGGVSGPNAPLPVGAPPSLESQPPPANAPKGTGVGGTQAYPMIPGAIPARPGHTAPIGQGMSRPMDPMRGTGRMIAPPSIQDLSPLPDASPEPGHMPKPFPDHSPEPIALQNLGTKVPASKSPSFPAHTPPLGVPTPIELASNPVRPAPPGRTEVGGMKAYAAMPAVPPMPSTSIGTPPPLPSPFKQTQIATAAPSPPAPQVAQNDRLRNTQVMTAAVAPQQMPGPTRPPSSPPGLPPPQGQLLMPASSSPSQRTPMAPSSWPAPPQPQVPLLIDVTPLTLAVETVGGYVDRVIARNTSVPCAQTRVFTTSVDNQVVVAIRVCQGESEAFGQNTALGALELSGLRAARRGEVAIEVTFELDADGILQVRAKDVENGRQTAAQMRLVGFDPAAVQGAPIGSRMGS